MKVKKTPKSTKVEIQIRVNAVCKLLQSGKTRTVITQYCAERWGVGQRATDDYISKARKEIMADFDVDRKQFTADILAQYASLQELAREGKQFSVALGCINSMARVGQVIT